MTSPQPNVDKTQNTSLFQRALLIVTGKGGVGKTTVAAALALRAAKLGKRTILCEVSEQHQARSLLSEKTNTDDENENLFVEHQIHENLFSLTIDPLASFEEFVAAQLRSRSLVRLLSQSNALKTFINAAPGAREMLTMMKAWELSHSKRWLKDKQPYDLVILDAPASGHGLGMIRVPTSYAEITRVGPLYNQIVQVKKTLADPKKSGYVAAALPAELPVSETLQLNDWLDESLDRPLDAVVINSVIRRPASASAIAELQTLEITDPNAQAAQQALQSLSRRVDLQQQQIRRLRRSFSGPTVTLPYLFHRKLERPDLEQFAEALKRLELSFDK